MLDISPISINFHIPATDHLGKKAVEGQIRFLAEGIELDWRFQSNVFRGETELHTIPLSYGEIEHVELIKKWWWIRAIELRISNPAVVSDIPGVNLGKLVIEIDKSSRSDAKKLGDYIDFKRSIFLVNEQTKRLEAMSEEI